MNPDQVRALVQSGVKVLIEVCNKRAYAIQEYVDAGAVISHDLSEASVIFGVKQVPIHQLIPNKTYCFFSHTIKAQPDNMPLLDALLEKNIRLVDYEKMVDDNGRRIVSFSHMAGISGTLNILHGMGLRLLGLGFNTPLMHIALPHNYPNVEVAKTAVRNAGKEIAANGVPKSMGPLTFALMGAGKVSKGCQEIFAELPVEYVKPHELKEVAQNGDVKKVYVSIIDAPDHLVREDKKAFSWEEYFKEPHLYRSIFSEEFAPWLSCIINGVLWSYSHPRTVTTSDIKKLVTKKDPAAKDSLPHRLVAICDITADPGGSIEFLTDCTSIEKPFQMYDAQTGTFKDMEFRGDGVLICSVSNMPSQLPTNSTDSFGAMLSPLIQELVTSNAEKPFEEEKFSTSIKSAIIVSNGKLTPSFEYIGELRKKNEQKEA